MCSEHHKFHTSVVLYRYAGELHHEMRESSSSNNVTHKSTNKWGWQNDRKRTETSGNTDWVWYNIGIWSSIFTSQLQPDKQQITLYNYASISACSNCIVSLSVLFLFKDHISSMWCYFLLTYANAYIYYHNIANIFVFCPINAAVHSES